MNVRIFNGGKEITIEQLDKEFTSEFLKRNPFGGLLVATLKLIGGMMKEASEELMKEEKPVLLLSEGKKEVTEENLFKEGDAILEENNKTPQCSGNPDDCPVCGENMLFNFSDALNSLKNDAKVVRKSWMGYLDVSYLMLISEGQTDIGMTSEPFIAVVSNDETRFEPYIIQNDDLLAEDWLLIPNKEN